MRCLPLGESALVTINDGINPEDLSFSRIFIEKSVVPKNMKSKLDINLKFKI